ncbi:MAG: ATPase, T2SS/T4P/T4SS family [Candidatus Subteraquimicrobiales bacterium]|nr:ATPase, T2SS/T4P/T4SS family [Candidatus Subteraquimicrobiales bacterium]
MVLPKKRLGKILVDSGLITEDQLQEAISSQDGRSLMRTLVDLGYVSEADVGQILANSMNLPFVDLGNYNINASAIHLVSEKIIRRYLVLPIDFEEDKLVVAMADPTNIFAIDDLRIITGYEIKPVVVIESDLLTTYTQFVQVGEKFSEMSETVALEIEEKIKKRIKVSDEELEKEAPVVRLVNLIIIEAVRNRANDIIIEPQEADLRIRYRVDGVCHEMMRTQKQLHSGLISRIKIIGGMDIAERRVPQDGRFGMVVDKKGVDFRVVTLPTIHGEMIVLRLLERESILYRLEDLGVLPEDLEKFQSSFVKPYGAILVTGPTGCGKTTTLYAALHVINTVEKNLITVEDPVEYRLAGVNQVQVNPKAGLTFASALRSILRNDPDIVMIGEIRDGETALIAIESALTGHLVFSTLHTNDAASALTRLTEMGIEPFLTASAVDCIVAQRLGRRLCKFCKEPYSPTESVLECLGLDAEKDKELTLYRAKGCKKCGGTGYRGRIGFYEVLMVSEAVERLVIGKASSNEIHSVAVSEGMKTLEKDVVEKVIQGINSVEEMFRAII